MARRKARPTPGDYLLLAEVCDYLHLSEDTLRRMVREGKFPKPIRHAGAGDQVWPGRVVRAYALLAPLLPDLFRVAPRKRRDPPSKTE